MRKEKKYLKLKHGIMLKIEKKNRMTLINFVDLIILKNH